MPTAAERTAELIALAGQRSPETQERMLRTLTELCESAPPETRAAIEAALGEVFLSVVRSVERDIRARLAEHIAEAAWAPHALVLTLALDEIEIARPLIGRSKLLADADLIRLLVEATIEHRIEVARRPDLPEVVCQAAADTGETPVLSALARNRSARCSARTMEQLILSARDLAELRAPLARHPRLTPALAKLLHGWVGATLREALTARFSVDADQLDPALAEALRWSYEVRPLPGQHAGEERERMDRRLVAKLHASGQLRPGALLKAVADGKLGLFELGLAALLGTSPDTVRTAVRSSRPELLAIACTGAGIDRGAYPALLTDLRKLTGGWPRTGEDSARRVTDAFHRYDAGSARQAFQAAALAA